MKIKYTLPALSRADVTPLECATVQIGSTEHRADDLIIAADRLRSKAAGWEVVL